MKSLFLFTFILITAFSTFSQKALEQDNSINGQFDQIYRTSTTYKPAGTTKRYKVINIKKYEDLKSNVIDSLKSSKKTISEKDFSLKTERNNIQKLNTTLNKTKLDLETALQKEHTISFFGAQLNKITYNLILWLIIITLAVCLGFFVFKYSKSHIVTKEAQENLSDVEQEFDIHRKKSIEREQKLRRQLQDEINKHRNV